MDQQADQSETPDTPEAVTRRDDDPVLPPPTPAPAGEPRCSIFPDPFGEEEAVELANQEVLRQPLSFSTASIADEWPVDPGVLVSEQSDDADVSDLARDQVASIFASDDERRDELVPLFLDSSNAGSSEDVAEVAANTDPELPLAPGAEVEPGPSGEDRDFVCPTIGASAAEIVGSAIQEIVSDLVGSLLQSVTSRESIVDAVREGITPGQPVPRESPSSHTTSGDGDHSYQWHALQEDDDADPGMPWEDQEPELAAGLPGKVAAFGAADRDAASGQASASSEPSPKCDPDDPGDKRAVPEGMLEYESSADDVPANGSRGGWTIPVLCAGIGIIACCLLIPLCDSNRRAAYERLRLRRDLESLQHQVATNDEFLHKVADDPTLAERLAERQLRKIRAGTHIVPLKDDQRAGLSGTSFGSMSPFGIVAVPPPPALAPYKPVGGKIATLCYNPHTRLYLMGAGLMLLAGGLVMGYGPMGGKTLRLNAGSV